MTVEAVGQTQVGAGVGWSRSRIHEQGGPLVSLLVQRRWPTSTSRFVVDTQIPSSRQVTLKDNGNGRLLAADPWSDGHEREVIVCTTLSMVSLAADHLFIIASDRADDRIDLRLGPGFAWSAEQLHYDHLVKDLTADTSEFHRHHRSRAAWNLRVTLGAAYRLPLGELQVEATTEMLTLDGREQGVVGSAWFQRQLFRVAAAFPIGGRGQ